MTPEDTEQLRATLNGKTPPDHAVRTLEEVCERTGLTWKCRQVYLIERGGKWSVTLSIDGFRTVASRSALYAGQAGPQWTTGPDGPWTDVPPEGKPYAARVGIRLTNSPEPTWGVAKYADYAAGPMWTKFASTMSAKVAEMLALRKALPVEFSGLYGVEEMDQAARSAPVAPVEERRAWAKNLADPSGLDERARQVDSVGLKDFLDVLRGTWKVDPDAANSARAILVERGLVK